MFVYGGSGIYRVGSSSRVAECHLIMSVMTRFITILAREPESDVPGYYPALPGCITSYDERGFTLHTHCELKRVTVVHVQVVHDKNIVHTLKKQKGSFSLFLTCN